MQTGHKMDTRLYTRLERASGFFLGAAILGVILCALSALHSRQTFLASYLTSFCFFLAISLGSLFFVMLQHLTRAAWSVTIRRTAETLAWNVVLLAVLSLPVLIWVKDLFPWARPEVMAADPVLQLKKAWLNLPGFYIRTALYFGIWIAMASYFLRTSRRQDKTGDATLNHKMGRVAAGGMVIYALTQTFFSFDWLMSLSPRWYSTLFGVYYFAGSIVLTFSVLILIGVFLFKGKLRRTVNVEHYHDLGKLLYGFNAFWAFIGFSQFILIWYTNIPEETFFYHQRAVGAWKCVSLTLPWLHFAVPFIYLMSYHIKRNLFLLSVGALGLFAMCFIDIYWLIQPNFHPAGATFGIADVGSFLAIGGFCATFFLHNLRQASAFPVKDPRLAECLSYDNGIPI